MFRRLSGSLLILVSYLVLSTGAQAASYLFETSVVSGVTTVKFQDGYTVILSAAESKMASALVQRGGADQSAVASFNQLHPFHKHLLFTLVVQFKDGVSVSSDGSPQSALFQRLYADLSALPQTAQQEIYRAAFVNSVFNFTSLKPENLDLLLARAARNDRTVEKSLICEATAVMGYFALCHGTDPRTAEYRQRIKNVYSNAQAVLRSRPYLRDTDCHQPFYDKGYFTFSVKDVLDRAVRIERDTRS